MVPLGLLCGFRYLVEALRYFTFYMLGAMLAFFRGWVGYLISSALALPASVPRGQDAGRAGGEASRDKPPGGAGGGLVPAAPRRMLWDPSGPRTPKESGADTP